MNFYDVFKLRALSTCLFASIITFALATPLAAIARTPWYPQVQPGLMLECIPTFNQNSTNAGLPQQCSLNVLQYVSGDGEYLVYDANCKRLGSTTGKVASK